MERIELILEFGPETMKAVRRIAKEDQVPVGKVLKEAILRGLARRVVRGAEQKKLPLAAE